MPACLQIGLIGDYDPLAQTHQATLAALQHAAHSLDLAVEPIWLPTPSLDPLPLSAMQDFDALWCVPGSPYQSMAGALNAIRFTREQGRPFLGTCGGFQHTVIEYARNVLGFVDAHHAEYDPAASTLFVTRLACSLASTTMQVYVEPHSRSGRAYQQSLVQEQYYCRFGLNPAYQANLHDGGLRVVGTDQDGEARIVELPAHPFFIGTLFVPQVRSTPAQPHPLVREYVEAARSFHESGMRSAIAGSRRV